MNNPFDYVPSPECDAAFGRLMEYIGQLRSSDNPDDLNFCRELDSGKMLGVLVTAGADGRHHTFYAFSGQLGSGGFHFPGFVGPVFDYLQPDGHFKRTEALISLQNREIESFRQKILIPSQQEYDCRKIEQESEIARCKERLRESKLRRNARRAGGDLDASEAAAMIRQSQFEKGELNRLKKQTRIELAPYAERLQTARAQLDSMKEKRRRDSEALQQWLFTNFRLLNAEGQSRSLGSIFADTPMCVPPSGSGECCAPKLLQAAYERGLKPLSIAEYWYGRPKSGEVRRHGEHYPACRGKCLPVLRWMLRGLTVYPPLDSDPAVLTDQCPEIVFENEWFCVIEKPSGMLSVPGKGAALSVQQWLADRYGDGRFVRLAHRLDRDTSGLIIAALTEQSYKLLQSMFATRQIHKTYIADLDGDFVLLGKERRGIVELPLIPDWLDRPRQRVDFDEGKPAVTDYEFISHDGERSRVRLSPLTGRTHQLRVHAASALGLGMPMVGDPLYGDGRKAATGRLHLHAHRIEFIFPTDGKHYTFESPVPFGRHI